jgi:hypothetical protein
MAEDLEELAVAVLDRTLNQAPTALTVTVAGAAPRATVVFKIDGTTVDEADTNSNGNIAPYSIPVPESVGKAGTHTVTATSGGQTASATFTLKRDPMTAPRVLGPDAQAVDVPGSVVNGIRKWVLQDLMPGGRGSYVMPYNPISMTHPHLERGLSAPHSTATTGQFHVYEEGPAPVAWEFKGYCPTQAMHDELISYRNLNRRFYVIDHRGRAWKVTFVEVAMVPRLRHIGFDGVATDWGHDYTVRALVYDQDWVTPATGPARSTTAVAEGSGALGAEGTALTGGSPIVVEPEFQAWEWTSISGPGTLTAVGTVRATASMSGSGTLTGVGA